MLFIMYINAMRATVIYSLIDPVTEEIRYIGKTNQHLKARLSAHLRETSSCHRVHWLNKLKAVGLLPKIAVIEQVPEGVCWQEREIYWISHLRSKGARLTNNTSGGDGVPDLPSDVRERIRAAWVGRKHTPETLKKLSKVRKGRHHTEEHKQMMREKMAGREITWGDKLAEAVRKLSHEEAEVIRTRLSSGERVKDLAAEYGMHRTSISKIKMGTYFDRYRKA